MGRAEIKQVTLDASCILLFVIKSCAWLCLEVGRKIKAARTEDSVLLQTVLLYRKLILISTYKMNFYGITVCWLPLNVESKLFFFPLTAIQYLLKINVFFFCGFRAFYIPKYVYRILNILIFWKGK